jgi:formate dehydrogenase subunit gamma
MRTEPEDSGSRDRRRRRAAWTLALILLGAVIPPAATYVVVAAISQVAVADQPPAAEPQSNPRANYWRAVRDGFSGYTSESGPYTTNVLIQNGGQNWRELRNGPVSTFLPWVLAVAILAIGAYHLLHGRVRLEHPPSGATIMRWTLGDRVLHWYTATLFIVLAITGLSMLFGRGVLIPLFGLNGFGVYASVAITLHNYLGPFFVVGVLLELIAWFRLSIPDATDREWLRQGGGLVGKGHPAAGRFNAGEKAWYWVIGSFGVAVCVTGLILDFPLFNQTRNAMQNANLIHDVCAVIWLAVALGHMYIGSIGTEGALEGMKTGYVSAEWAKQHHSLWYDEARRHGESGEGRAAAPRTPSPHGG